MITATENTAKTFTIDKVKGEFTAKRLERPTTAQHGYAWIASAVWSKLTINGVDYPEGQAFIMYRHDSGYSADLALYGGIWGRNEFTDAAEKTVANGILEALEELELLELPDIDAINAGALDSARYAGQHAGNELEGSSRKSRDYTQILSAITGHRTNVPNAIPAAPGALTADDIRRAYLEAAREAITKELDALKS